MNTRKFYFVISSILSVCLFFVGVFLLASVKIPGLSSNGSIIDSILDPLKSENEPVNILVLGGDKVSSNTDTMILVNYNPSTAKMSMMSIPRDTKVNVKGSSLPKINSAYSVGGGKQAVDTVSNLLNVKIKYYVFINTTAFRQIIDTLDGVDYNVPVDMNYEDPTQDLYIHLNKGLQHMDGDKAEQFMRFRQPSSYNNEIMKYYDGSDLKRINAQQDFIKELIKQKVNIKYISKADDIINIIFRNIDTNIAINDAAKLTQNLAKLNVGEINTFTLPGEPQEGGAWYYIMNAEKSQEIVKEYFDAKSGLTSGVSKPNNKPIGNESVSSTQKPVVKPVVTATPEPTTEPVQTEKPTPVPTVAPTPTTLPTPSVPTPSPTPKPSSTVSTTSPTPTMPASTTKPGN